MIAIVIFSTTADQGRANFIGACACFRFGLWGEAQKG
jgi:hypothetical protein